MGERTGHLGLRRLELCNVPSLADVSLDLWSAHRAIVSSHHSVVPVEPPAIRYWDPGSRGGVQVINFAGNSSVTPIGMFFSQSIDDCLEVVSGKRRKKSDPVQYVPQTDASIRFVKAAEPVPFCIFDEQRTESFKLAPQPAQVRSN